MAVFAKITGKSASRGARLSMGWRGTLRSVAAAVRAAERAAERRRKADAKARSVREAAAAVDDWSEYIEALKSVHVGSGVFMNWGEIANAPAPQPPAVQSKNRSIAEYEINKFRPSLMHIFKGGSRKVYNGLQNKLREAIRSDEIAAHDAFRKFEEDLAEWEKDRELAVRLLQNDVCAKIEVIEEMQSLADVELLGRHVSFRVTADLTHAILEVHSSDIVPRTRKRQLASGRLSETKMPVSEFNELYQDYVASAALRVGCEILGILPDQRVVVTCVARMLNKATGHQEDTPILSVDIVKKTISEMNLNSIDPSDALERFRHRMSFSRTKGFSSIEPLAQIRPG